MDQQITDLKIKLKYVMEKKTEKTLDFFNETCCSKMGAEINDVADQMLDICLSEAPNLFSTAGAPCAFGKCNKENSCGNKREAKIKQIIKTY